MKAQKTKYLVLAFCTTVIILAGFAAGFLLMAGMALFQNVSQREPISPDALYELTPSVVVEKATNTVNEQVLLGIFDNPEVTPTGIPGLANPVQDLVPPECGEGNYSQLHGNQEAQVIKSVMIFENLKFLEDSGSQPKIAADLSPGEVIWVVKDKNSPQVYPGLYFWKVRESGRGDRLGFVLEYFCTRPEAHSAFSDLENGYFLIPNPSN